jgi:hypothetical protein
MEQLMKIGKLGKIILGILTTWAVIAPFLLFALWFFFIISMAVSSDNQAQPSPISFLSIFFPFLLLVLFTGLVHVGLQIFYIVHAVLNKTGSDVVRSILAVGMFLFPIVAMPVYYLVYIMPGIPPQWALSSNVSSTSRVVLPE